MIHCTKTQITSRRTVYDMKGVGGVKVKEGIMCIYTLRAKNPERDCEFTFRIPYGKRKEVNNNKKDHLGLERAGTK